ncbi:hypothetical protein [Virgibacillus sp. CBA3643]|uniref:hypothetical protein n=1 Tax=Virgibacillus sp. CBA3643 TaxID=2942278 RepID=UPI0035A36DED
MQKKKNTSNTERLGYVTYDAHTWKFVDVTESERFEIYPINANISDKELTIDQPAKATLKQDGVTITKLFTSMEPTPIPPRKRSPSTKTPRRKYRAFGNFKVLILGSRFMSEYKHRLENHGCHVEIHNPYEESFEVLKGKINRAEIILVCEGHIPHSIWDYVDRAAVCQCFETG